MAHLGQRIAVNEPRAHNPQVEGSSPSTATNPLKINSKTALSEVKPDVARQIPLTQGKFALVDAADYDLLSMFKWYACRRGQSFYAGTNIKGRKFLMHLLLLGKRPGLETDHINRNGLDNRRSNLRQVTHAENMRNRRMLTSNKSGFRGVRSYQGRHIAALKYYGKEIYLGSYSTAEEAARAFDAKAKELVGKFACLNFPEVAP